MKKLIFYVIAAIAAITLFLGLVRMAWVIPTTTTITDTFVRDSERVCSANDATQCKYLAYGRDETYENTDEWLFMKYNSSDVNKELVKGATCEMKVYGFRWKFFSWYRNIITAKC